VERQGWVVLSLTVGFFLAVVALQFVLIACAGY